jgi:tRNA(His) 5'-end guanylyltransferase
MKFDELDKKMRVFETSHDLCVLPNWQKRGIGIYWKKYEKQGFNPIACKAETAIRNRLNVDMDLQMKDQYSAFIESLITASESGS